MKIQFYYILKSILIVRCNYKKYIRERIFQFLGADTLSPYIGTYFYPFFSPQSAPKMGISAPKMSISAPKIAPKAPKIAPKNF